jgi:hypothetical protein
VDVKQRERRLRRRERGAKEFDLGRAPNEAALPARRQHLAEHPD